MPGATSKEIQGTFYTTPRNGYKQGIVWIKREEEKKLDFLLDGLGESICIDGPTGTGKSSLALTILKKKQIEYLKIQVTVNMTWRDFCRCLLNARRKGKSIVKIDLDAGIDKGLPVFKLHFGFEKEYNARENLDYEERVLDQMTDHKICEILHREGLTLLIDDFERASSEILSNVGEMCKLITMTYISNKTRLVIVGTDDIYKRLTDFNKSLEGRLKELSLGTINKPNESWKFLIDGFNKLNLKHPGYEYRVGIGSVTYNDLKQCARACTAAADGLLKSLNELGAEISWESTNARRISKSTILRVSKRYVEKNLKKFNRDYPQIAHVVTNNKVAEDIVIYFYKTGIGQIHNWSDISDGLDEQIDVTQIENAICELVAIKFLTRTGYNGEILYVSNPTMAHTLGVVLSDPDEYKVPRDLKTKSNQLVLPLLSKSTT